MFFFIPVNTDAPIYHWPFITVGLIVANVLVHLGFDPEGLALRHDGAWHPQHWVTSNFAHVDWTHLIGNMICLWAFGLIVEGKLGWWKFLLVYMGIGIAQNIGEQALMMIAGAPGGSLGASSVIYGLMAMSLVWAPKNNIECLFAYFIVYFDVKQVSVSILTFCGVYVGFDFLLAMLSGFQLSTATLHVSGAALGLVVGLAMLKWNLVDCEGWDILSVWAGKTDEVQLISDTKGDGVTNADKALGNIGKGFDDSGAQGASAPQQTATEESEFRVDLTEAHQKMRQALHHGKLELALGLHRQLSQNDSRWQLDRAELTHLIRMLHTNKRWEESIPLMEEYLRQHPDTSGRVRVQLAQIYIVDQGSPSKGLKILKEMRAAVLDEEVVELRRALMIEARKMIEDGVLELQDEA